MRQLSKRISRRRASLEDLLYTSQSKVLVRISKAILFVGLRGKPFDPQQYMLWNVGRDWGAINPYIHAALFGLRQMIFEFSSKFKDVVRNEPAQDKKWILIVTHDQSRTGAPILALSVATELAKIYNIVTLALGPGNLRDNFSQTSAVLIQNHGARKKSRFLAKRIRRLCSEFTFEYALVNSKESIHVTELLSNFGVKTSSLFHEFPAYSPYSLEQKISIQASNRVVVSSNLLADEICEVVNKNRLSVIPQGRPNIPPDLRFERIIDLDFRRAVERAFAVDRHDGHLRVLGAGAVIFRKGIDLFISLALAAQRSPSLQGAKFVWVGDGLSETDADYSPYLFDQIRRSGIGDSLEFLPGSADFEFAVQTSDVLALTSRLDPLPNVVIDSLSNGRHVVCFDSASGFPELFREHSVLSKGVSSYLDVESMVSRLESLSEAKQSGTLQSERASIMDFATERFDLKKYSELLDRISST